MASANNPEGSKQQRKRLSNEDYTVGWICTLEAEYVAARAVLDQKHDLPADIAAQDSNDYTLGRIGEHNVSIAVLPVGEYGIKSASLAARDMLHTFPNIRVVLMVGIGGGAPNSEHDIRLGDVIVGEPRSELGGVLQCDFRKAFPDQIISFSAPPQPILLRSISTLRAEYVIHGHNIRQRIEASLTANERLREKYSRPDATTDRLYKSHVVHPIPMSNIPCVESCGVHYASMILRASRDDDSDPTIHYGLIASADQVMNDAKLRDQFANNYNILCFEMAASGFMNCFPFLVIRGICNYSDTHKYKEWQGYAAMTAAAYAKDLLNTITPNGVEAERRIGELFVNHFNDVIKWLSSPDPSINLKHARELHQPGTNQWFLDSDKYMSWKTRRASFLCVYGIPGCGKTILTSAVITDLEEDLATSGEVIYFYFTIMERHSTENAVRSLIHQLYCKRASARLVIDLLYASYRNSGQQPTCVVLQTALNDMIQECGEVWIVLDGLDECVSRSQYTVDGIIPWIEKVERLLSKVHLLVTSRLEQDIRSSIKIWADSQQAVLLHPDLMADDIEAYIRTKVGQMSIWKHQPDIQKSIATSLNGRANGMFLWVACQIERLETCLNRKDVSIALAELPRTLEKTYARILERLPLESKTRGIRLLQILVCSKRPLLTEEALDTLVSKPRFDTASRMFIEREIARCCSSLVYFTPKYYDKTGDHPTEIGLVHFSVQEYLQSNRSPTSISTYFDEERLVREFPDQLAPKRALAQLMVDIYSGKQTANADTQSVASLSDVSSVFTKATNSTRLRPAFMRIADPLQMEAQSLAHHLYQDPVVHDLYSDAVQELGSIRFSVNYDRLLKIFWKEVFRGTLKPKIEGLVRVLAKRRSRSLVTAYILRLFQIELDSSRQGGASMQRAFDQQEELNFILNHLVRYQQPVSPVVADTDELVDCENDEETDDEDEVQDPDPGTFNEVGKVFEWITAGAPYQTFKSNLACLAHPPANLPEALNAKNLRALRRLFRTQFNTIAQDEYAWLHDLEDLGLTRDEIAEILLEEARDPPWIYFTHPPEPLPMIGTRVDFHIPGCVHRLTWNSLREDKDVHAPTNVASSKWSTSVLDIQRLCGLAGITPSSRDIEEWNGSVSFEEGNSTALITYGDSNTRKVIHRLEVTLGLLCTAIRQCQSQQLCCDSFTIIKHPPTLVKEGDHNQPSVEVGRIDFSVAFQLLDEVRVLNAAQDAAVHKLPTATKLLQDVFQEQQRAGLSEEAVSTAAIHECSLSIQMMCLGFLSYLQAHVGPLRLVFLDTPIRKARLFGSGRIQRKNPLFDYSIIKHWNPLTRIEVDLAELTCVGNMLKGPVFVFRLAEKSFLSRPPLNPQFDLITNAEDLVDTWGPAQFIIQDKKAIFLRRSKLEAESSLLPILLRSVPLA